MSVEDAGAKVDAARASLLASEQKVVQWLNVGCSSTVAAVKRECSSPTRAPSGWSLSLSVSRAKRAQEEEERSQAREGQSAARQGARSSGEDGFALLKQEQPELVEPKLEDVEIPASPPPSPPAFPAINVEEECRLKTVVLEQQICVLRKANAQLLDRLSEKEDAHLKVSALQKANARLLHRLQTEEEAHLKKCSALEKDNGKLQCQLKAAGQLDKAHIKETEDLKKDNATLFLRHEMSKSEISALSKANAKLTSRLREEEDAHVKKCLSLRKENDSLQSLLKAVEEWDKVHIKEIEDLKKDKVALSAQLQKSKSEAIKIAQEWAKRVEALKAKVENQKKNLAGMTNKLASKQVPAIDTPRPEGHNHVFGRDCFSGCATCSRKFQDMEDLLSRQRERMTNQAIQLTNLGAALAREKDKQQRKSADNARLTFQQEAALESKTRRSPMQTEALTNDTRQPEQSDRWMPPLKQVNLAEKEILQVATRTYPMATIIMKNYDELAQSLPDIRPAVRAAIAAMPPATRSLCLSQSKASHPAACKQLSPDKLKIEVSAPAAQPSGPVPPRPSPCRGVGAASGAQEGPVSAAGDAPGLVPADPSSAERCTREQPESSLPLPVYGPSPEEHGTLLPTVGSEVPRLEGPTSCEAPAVSEPAAPKVGISEAAAQVESGSEPQMDEACEGPSTTAKPCPAEAKTASMPPAVPLALASPDAQRAPKSSPLPLASWAVPLTVSYPQYLYEGGKYQPPAQPVPTTDSAADDQGTMLPPPPVAVPLRLPQCPAAVPIAAASRPRKRSAEQEGGDPASVPERKARIVSRIQGLKKRIVQHLQLKGKPEASESVSSKK